MRHFCLLSLLLLPLLLPATTSNFLVDGRPLREDAAVAEIGRRQDGSDATELKLKPKGVGVGVGGGVGGGGCSDMSNRRELLDQRMFTLASGPSRRGDGHK